MTQMLSCSLSCAVFVLSLILFVSLITEKPFAIGIPKTPRHASDALPRSISRKRDAFVEAVSIPRPKSSSSHGPDHGKGPSGVDDSAPCCVVRGRRTDCFIRDKESRLFRVELVNRSIIWTSLDMTVVDEVECVLTLKGDVEVLAVNRHRQLLIRSLTDEMWTAWMPTNGVFLKEAPSCVNRPTGDVECVYRGMDNSGYWIRSTGGKWAKEVVPLGGVLMSRVHCTSGDEAVTCYSMGVDGRVQVFRWSSVVETGTWMPIGDQEAPRDRLSTPSSSDLSKDVVDLRVVDILFRLKSTKLRRTSRTRV